MKKILIMALLVISLPAVAQIKAANLTASGLTCSMCSKAIYKALLNVSTVKEVQADIKNSSYEIQFKEGVNVVIDDIKKAVEGAGFSVASMKVKAAFNNIEVSNDAHISLGGSDFHFLGIDKQTLNGEKKMTIVDKNYLPAKEFRKYSKNTKMKCFETGMSAACCFKNGAVGRIYHVTL